MFACPPWELAPASLPVVPPAVTFIHRSIQIMHAIFVTSCCSACFVLFYVFVLYGPFWLVPLNLICLHCLQHVFFEHLFNSYSDRRELVFTCVCKEHFDMKYNVHNVSLHLAICLSVPNSVSSLNINDEF